MAKIIETENNVINQIGVGTEIMEIFVLMVCSPEI
jgi:hypothetical protein